MDLMLKSKTPLASPGSAREMQEVSPIPLVLH
jgi:hypothetical protein